MDIAGRTLRVSRQQVLVYVAALAFILSPELGLTKWILDNIGDFTVIVILGKPITFTKVISLVQIIVGGLSLAGARSFISRKEWSQPEREDKITNPAKPEATPPSK